VNIDEFRDAATRLGHPLAVELSYEEGDTSFVSQLEQIKSLNVDGVFTYGNSRESALILKQMRQMGMEHWFFGSDRMVTQEFLDIAGPNYGKVAAGYPYDPSNEDPRYVQFVEDFRAEYGEDPETYAAHAYDGIMMLIEAIQNAGLNRALIRDQLVEMRDYVGVTGPKELDAVFSDRSPAALAILRNSRFEFLTAEEALADTLDLGSGSIN
jgi:ABC-type branched-subunit amino acid transport system substrate-binding protein